ncbi:MAG TPA: hypothetical protein VFE33_02090 [Thermoanaerobaculia bacterium]|nr:hypothetical protein [Thermoanaerobaculia bacterium]
MSFALAQKVADAVLYEGYVLYPDRTSAAKNQMRFQLGVVAPKAYCLGAGNGAESWEMQTECLVEPSSHPGADPRIDLKIRCLQLQSRTLEEATEAAGTDALTFRPVEFLEIDGGELLVAWDEGVESELVIEDVSLLDLVRDGLHRFDFVIPAGSDVEELRSASGTLHGRLTRRRWPISVDVFLSAERLAAEGLLRLRVRIENRTPWPKGRPAERQEALHHSLLSAHTLIAVADGRFVSLLDPPPEAARAAAECSNLRTWPVLVGDEGSGDLLLSSPILLYDHPAIAPEGQGDLCSEATR